MLRLFEMVLIETPEPDDWEYANRLAMKILKSTNIGLPSQMWASARECADNFLIEGIWMHYNFLCLLLVQARHKDMTDEGISARLELERLFMDAMFGRMADDAIDAKELCPEKTE